MIIQKANDTNERAQNIYDDAVESLKVQRKFAKHALEDLGKEKVYILKDGVHTFCEQFSKIKNVNLKDSLGLDEVNKIKNETFEMGDLQEMSNVACDMAAGVVGGAGLGALTAFGAWGAATTFAAASIGTAIASLSGVAATNATLAFFGGGSLAAGGLGMTAGAAVLGGLVAGPALAVMGLVLGNKASKNLDNAYSNLEEARKIKSDCKAAAAVCRAIHRRAYMFLRLLIRLDALFIPLLDNLIKVIDKSGDDWLNYSDEEKHSIAACVSVVQTIKAVLDTSILDKDGALTAESEKVAIATNSYIEHNEKA